MYLFCFNNYFFIMSNTYILTNGIFGIQSGNEDDLVITKSGIIYFKKEKRKNKKRQTDSKIKGNSKKDDNNI